MPLLTTPGDGGLDVGSTMVYFGLDGVNQESSQVSTIVHRVDFSCPDPAAVFEIHLVRIESSGSPFGYSRFFRGNQAGQLPAARLAQFSSPTVSHHLGRYYHHAASGLFLLKFASSDEFESLRDAETNADHKPAIGIARVDDTESLGVHVNFWYEEY